MKPLYKGNYLWVYSFRNFEYVGLPEFQVFKDFEGVDILATCGASFLVQKQFRPSLGKFVLGFPSGFRNPLESAPETALRELREETGYNGSVGSVSAPYMCDWWKSFERGVLVEIRVGDKGMREG